MSELPTIIEVAIPLHLNTSFHYRVPPDLVLLAQPGKRVLVPFGRRKLTGYLLGVVSESREQLRDIIEVLDQEPLFTPAELDLYRWMAAYYHHPLGEVIKTALPAGINIQSSNRTTLAKDGRPMAEEVMSGGRKVKSELFYLPLSGAETDAAPRGKAVQLLQFLREAGEASATLLRQRFGAVAPQLKRLVELGLVRGEAREVYRDPFREEVFERDQPLVLNVHQHAAKLQITAALDSKAFAPFLLHGVTGSGKTEVYLQAIAHGLEQGKTALVLVPEIALTPQLVKRFKRRFACGIAVLHSGLSDGERYDEWRRIRRDEVTIVIGARSALFAPLQRLGIIVVDEEHEDSYKQSEGFRYNARDMALVRGKRDYAVVVLGSATPLVTSYHAALEKKLGYLSLPGRVRDLPMPATELLDMRGRKGDALSPGLIAELGANLAKGGQSLLFLNRRGFATFLICQDCGHVLRCPNCSVTLTYHRGRGRHFCHYCDYFIAAPSVCPGCGGPEIGLLGRGTERVEEEIRELFPQARVSRMDRDTTRGRGGHARILKGVETGEIDILIGTQMIAKGHDFPGVTLVGVLSADASLNLPDFRSAERTFQLVSQVMGRAGRGDLPGRVLIQSLEPAHYTLTRAAAHDFAGFYADEIAFRHEVGYPPFAHLASLNLTGNSPAGVERGAKEAAAQLRSIRQELQVKVEILGPAAAPLAKIRGRYRWQILLKATRRSELHRLLAGFGGKLKLPPVVRMGIDIDPVDML